MTDPHDTQDDSAETYDLDIETIEDTDEIMREAVEAVDSYRREAAEDASSEAADEQTEVEESEDRGALERELREAKERTVRALADYENFRRRVDRERADLTRYASERALLEFLPVLDNLERAIAAEGDYEDLKSGVELIHKQMQELLARLDVTIVPAVGERFDPAVHEAVAREESDEVEQPTVLDEYQVGYSLHERLLRPSMVRVAVPAEAEAANDETDSDETD